MGRGRGGLLVAMHSRSRMSIDARTPTIRGDDTQRRTSVDLFCVLIHVSVVGFFQWRARIPGKRKEKGRFEVRISALNQSPYLVRPNDVYFGIDIVRGNSYKPIASTAGQSNVAQAHNRYSCAHSLGLSWRGNRSGDRHLLTAPPACVVRTGSRVSFRAYSWAYSLETQANTNTKSKTNVLCVCTEY